MEVEEVVLAIINEKQNQKRGEGGVGCECVCVYQGEKIREGMTEGE